MTATYRADDSTIAARLMALSASPIFRSLPKPAKRGLARKLEWRIYTPETVILTRDEGQNDVFLLASGTVQVTSNEDPKRRVRHAQLQPGDIFGEMAAIDPSTRSAFVIAESECAVGAMSRKTFIRLATENQQVAAAVLGGLAGRIRAANQNLDDKMLLNDRQRVGKELLRCSEPNPANPEQRRIHPLPMQKEIGRALGITRQTVARWMTAYEDDGVITRSGRTLTILDPGALQQAVEYPK